MRATPVSLGLVLSLMTFTTGSAETLRWVPAAASNDGAQGTRWTTTLWLHNMAEDAPITVFAALCGDQEGDSHPAEVPVEVPPVQPLEIEDAVLTLFGESRSGAIRLRSEHPFDARSRTLNQGGAGGTFGQGIPAVDPAEALPFGALLGVANIPGEDGVRSNMGILNPNDRETVVWVFIIKNDEEGEYEYLNTFRRTIGPNGWIQGNLFALADDEAVVVDNAWAVVMGDDDPVQPQTPILFYLSRIDNRSGDATYIEPFLNTVYWLDPEAIEITYSITAGDTFAPYAITYEDASGDAVTVFDPPSDWSASVQTTLGRTPCLEVIGRVTGDGDGVEACIAAAGDDATATTCNSCDGEAGTLCRLETCRFLY